MSVVQICNRGGSQYLGIGRINSLDEDTPQAEQYDLHYNDLRRSLLERHEWSFAKARQPLAQMENDRPSEWAFKYQKPSNIIKVHWVNSPIVATANMKMWHSPDSDRYNEGDFIYCNEAEAYIEFTRDEQNTDLMPSYFKDALSAMIAAAIAMPLTQSVDRARFANDQAEFLIDHAVAADREQLPPEQMPEASYIAARTGGH